MNRYILSALLLVCLCFTGCKSKEPAVESTEVVEEESTTDSFSVNQADFNKALGVTEESTVFSTEGSFEERVKDLETVAVTQVSGEKEVEYVVEDITPTQEITDTQETQEVYEDARSYIGLTDEGEAVAKLSTISLSSGHAYTEEEAIVMDNLIYNWVTDDSLTEDYIDETLSILSGLSSTDKTEIKEELLKRYSHYIGGGVWKK